VSELTAAGFQVLAVSSGAEAIDALESGGLRSPPGTHVGRFHARTLGVPVAMVNKTGRWSSPVIGSDKEITGFFPGQSAIVDGDGTDVRVLGAEEGVGVADVRTGTSRTMSAPARCEGDMLPELTLTAPESRSASLQAGSALEAQASVFYRTSEARRAKARSISAK
jgi:hypothetical protein